MRPIQPTQFLEIFMQQQKMFSVPDSVIKVRDFNKMIRELYSLNIPVGFGYSDLVDTVNAFNGTIKVIDFGVHIRYAEKILRQLEQYNSIYESIAEIKRKTELWKDLMK